MRSLLALPLLLLSGCQAMMYGLASDLNAVHVGMTKQEVIAAVGTPDTATAYSSREEVLKFRRMRQVLGWTTTLYFVRLLDGKAESWGHIDELEAARATR